jgi:aminopeptidase N
MSRLILLFICCLFTSFVYAQEENGCSIQKIHQANKIAKKTRASVTDNALMQKYDVHHYFLDVHIERDTALIDGNVTISATTTQAMDTFCFELNSELMIDSIWFNNNNIAFTRVADITYIPVTTLSANTACKVKIYYHGNASVVNSSSAFGGGFSNDTSPSWGNEVTWSLSEPFSAYEWFPCKQFLEDKADSATIYITTNNQNKAGSNGILQGIDSIPNNKLRYRWNTTYTIDYYLISIAVAKYIDYTIYAYPASMPNDSIKIVNYIYDNPLTLPACKLKVDSVAYVLEYYSDLFGLYPFANEKYGHCMAPIGGGMEHQTMSTMGNLTSFRVNAHELMHQWWGDHVTCKTWGDIFINEGFASYGEYLAYEEFRSLTAANNLMRTVHNSVMADTGGSIYFVDTTSDRIFSSRLSYDKGNAVIHTLRYVLGDAIFFQALKNFQNQFSFANASIMDLKQSVETTSAVNLTDFFNQWLFGAGYPTVSAEFNSTGNTIYLNLSQVGSSIVTPLFKTPIDVKLHSASGDTTVKVQMNMATNMYQFTSNKIIDSIKIDAENWVLNKVGTIVRNEVLSTNYSLLKNSIDIYPNPVTDLLHIMTDKTILQLEVRNSVGQLISKSKNQTSLQVKQLHSGVYFVTIYTNEGNVVKKFIKN